MSIVVNIQANGVDISDPEKKREIFLSKNAWENLVECRKQVEHALKGKYELHWKIDAEKDIRAHTGQYHDQWYVHIRYWWQDRPTKRGVAIFEGQWENFTHHMIENPEFGLGRAVLKQLIKQRLSDAIRDRCDGCFNDWPSQTDHQCLMDAKATAELVIKEVTYKIPVYDFILMLAQEACKSKLILETPHQTFKRLRTFHASEIHAEILATYTD